MRKEKKTRHGEVSFGGPGCPLVLGPGGKEKALRSWPSGFVILFLFLFIFLFLLHLSYCPLAAAP